MRHLAIAAMLTATLTGCASPLASEPKPTLRAPECFDGTVEPYCPSWAHEAPEGKKVSHFSATGDIVFMYYTDGTKKRVK